MLTLNGPPDLSVADTEAREADIGSDRHCTNPAKVFLGPCGH